MTISQAGSKGSEWNEKHSSGKLKAPSQEEILL